MSNTPARPPIPRAQALAERAFNSLDRFLHIEAVSGLVLLACALAALIWANSPVGASYEALWHTEFSIGIGRFVFSQSLHFWINDGLMTIFFLVVGMEIRNEMHAGSLSNLRQAALPIAAAMGGVVVPALIFLAVNHGLPTQHGWAVPTATDIAFAVGVLALLGKSIPSNVRIFLLALAIIDDIIAVLIIAVFYSGGLDYSGLILVAAGLALVIGLQRIGIGSAYVYVIPGLIVWIGLLITGAHPTLAGVALGLMTPISPTRMRERPAELLARATTELLGDGTQARQGNDAMKGPLKQLHLAKRELLAPVVRVQMALHPWVAYLIMPLFALANAGVNLSGGNTNGHAALVMGGVILALTVGKPVGVIATSWLMVRLGWCRLPPDVTWGGVCLIGLLAGIGFTMSIFIAMLAFSDQSDLNAAKLGVLMASLLSAIIGLAWGFRYRAGLAAAAK
jgi:NhaA family Na+:H+ antiporter